MKSLRRVKAWVGASLEMARCFPGGLLVAIMGTLSSAAQQISVVDAQCRANLIAACIKDQEHANCPHGEIVRSQPSYGDFALLCVPKSEHSIGRSFGEQCAIRADTYLAKECIRTIDLTTIASGPLITKELSETNAILRSDMRLLLNQFCKSYSPKPETCDTSIPVSK